MPVPVRSMRPAPGCVRLSPPAPPASELREEAAACGIGQNALYAARKAEGIRLSKERKVHGRWLWSLQTTPGGSELGLAESALPNP